MNSNSNNEEGKPIKNRGRFYPTPPPEDFQDDLYWRNHPQRMVQYIDPDTLQPKLMTLFIGKQTN